MAEITSSDRFGSSIINVLKRFKIKSALEIGSWDGSGSTSCFVEGMEGFDNKSLTCLEIDSQRFLQLQKNMEKYPWVKCVNESSISYNSMIYKEFDKVWDSPYNGLPRQWNPKEVVQGWFDRDIENLKKINTGFLEKDFSFYESVLIDGGEFVGYSEFKLLKDRTNFFFLDDAFSAFKTREAANELISSVEWDCLDYHENTRNGFIIFKRRSPICLT
jgi:hypothetical protein